ncbi:MAG: hypothetical protein SWJ54_21505, partial [Cyanobacteriota bacterium]|nr:hypothetical protein [Cyanobacteriota bacterium]
MLVLEYKAKPNKQQVQAIEEAIRTGQFVRNSCLRYWMDNSSKENPIGKKELLRYNTKLRGEYGFVNQLNSHACQASVERAWFSISRFLANCQAKKSGKKAENAVLRSDPAPPAGARECRPREGSPQVKGFSKTGYPKFKPNSR